MREFFVFCVFVCMLSSLRFLCKCAHAMVKRKLAHPLKLFQLFARGEMRVNLFCDWYFFFVKKMLKNKAYCCASMFCTRLKHARLLYKALLAPCCATRVYLKFEEVRLYTLLWFYTRC